MVLKILEKKTFLIVGMCNDGLELLRRLCVDGAILRFDNSSMADYSKSFAICHNVDVYEGEPADIIINFDQKYIMVKEKTFSINKINNFDAYIQGMHEFYL